MAPVQTVSALAVIPIPYRTASCFSPPMHTQKLLIILCDARKHPRALRAQSNRLTGTEEEGEHWQALATGEQPPGLVSLRGTPCSGSCGACACRWPSRRSLYTASSGGRAGTWPSLCSPCSDSCGGCAHTAPSRRNLCRVSFRGCVCSCRVSSWTDPALRPWELVALLPCVTFLLSAPHIISDHRTAAHSLCLVDRPCRKCE